MITFYKKYIFGILCIAVMFCTNVSVVCAVDTTHVAQGLTHTELEMQDSMIAKIAEYERNAWVLRYSDPVTAFESAQNGIVLAFQVGSFKDVACLYNYCGVILKQFDYLDWALDNFYKALMFADKYSVLRERAYALHNIGNVYVSRMEYDSASFYVFKALDIFKATDNMQGVAYCYKTAGVICFDQRNFKDAENYFSKSLDIMRTIKLSHTSVYPSIRGVVNSNILLGNYNKAREYLVFGIDSAKSCGLTQELALFKICQARLYEHTEKFDSSLFCVNEALAMLPYGGYFERKIVASSIMASVYQKKHDYKKACDAFNLVSAYTDSSKMASADVSLRGYKTRSKISSLAQSSLKDQSGEENDVVENHFLGWIVIIFPIIIAITIVCIILKKVRIKSKKSSKLQKNDSEELLMLKQTIDKQSESLTKLRHTLQRLHSFILYEVSNPLEEVISLSKHVNDSTFDINKARDYMTQIFNTSTQNHLAFDNLVKLARLNAGKMKIRPEDVNLGAIVRKYITVSKGIAVEKYIDISTDIPETIIVNVDRFCIGIVLKNLITSAIKYAPTEGNLTISYEFQPLGFIRIFVKGTMPYKSNDIDDFTESLDVTLCKELVVLHGGTFDRFGSSKNGVFSFTIPYDK